LDLTIEMMSGHSYIHSIRTLCLCHVEIGCRHVG
jgi:hypothetical protein